MPARVTGRVHGLELKRRFAVELDDFTVLDKSIDVDVAQNVCGLSMSGNCNVSAEMRFRAFTPPT